MEYLEGIEGHALAHAALLSMEEAVEIAVQALDALALAHEAGVVHRDIKPANLFLSREAPEGARLKLLDFGIVKLLETAADERLRPTGQLTAQRSVMGTLEYMSPEQAMDASTAGPASDLYSLGATLFEMLTREPVVTGDSDLQVLGRVARGEIRRHPAELSPTIPPEVDAAVARALQHDPAARFGSAREMQGALLEALQRNVTAEQWTRRGEWLRETLERRRQQQQQAELERADTRYAADVAAPPHVKSHWRQVAIGVLGGSLVAGGGYLVCRALFSG